MKFNEVLNNIKNYEAGKPIEEVARDYGVKNIIKLASNENPYKASSKVRKFIAKNAKNAHLYPDDSMFELKSALAYKFKVKKENLIIGAGSDQIIEFATKAKINSKNSTLMAKTTFAMYEIYTKLQAGQIIRCSNEFHNLEEFEKLYLEHKEKLGIIFLCIPNNPLGECLDTKLVYDFLSKIDKNIMVIIDGAYQEFAAYKDKNKKIIPSDLISKFDNVLYLGTFSKAYALGGMRIGYGIANPNIIDSLYKIRPPFNVTTLSLKAAQKALEDKKFLKNSIENNFKEMKKYERFAKKLNIDFIESYANFITYKFENNINSSKISEELLKKGIIIRDLKSYGLNAIRITIGTKEQNLRFFEKFKKIFMKMSS